MVKFSRTGGEAAAIAIRIARAHNKERCNISMWLSWMA